MMGVVCRPLEIVKTQSKGDHMFARLFTTGVCFFVSTLARVATITAISMTLGLPARAEQANVSRTPQQRQGNAVTQWNAIALDAFAPTEGTNPMMQSRTFAILHAAIHDALNAIDRRFEPYTAGLADSSNANADAAVAAAAREILITLVPEQAALIDAAYDRALTTIPDGVSKIAGIATGQAAARATLDRRQRDGAEAATQPAYVPRSGPGEYQFTEPFTLAFQPGWGRIQPFVI